MFQRRIVKECRLGKSDFHNEDSEAIYPVPAQVTGIIDR
jgi:hypothetical protein